jgi:hypothetical protein
MFYTSFSASIADYTVFIPIVTKVISSSISLSLRVGHTDVKRMSVSGVLAGNSRKLAGSSAGNVAGLSVPIYPFECESYVNPNQKGGHSKRCDGMSGSHRRYSLRAGLNWTANSRFYSFLFYFLQSVFMCTERMGSRSESDPESQSCL